MRLAPWARKHGLLAALACATLGGSEGSGGDRPPLGSGGEREPNDGFDDAQALSGAGVDLDGAVTNVTDPVDYFAYTRPPAAATP